MAGLGILEHNEDRLFPETKLGVLKFPVSKADRTVSAGFDSYSWLTFHPQISFSPLIPPGTTKSSPGCL